MIKFLADENIPPGVNNFLTEKGFNVKAVQELVASGSADSTVIKLAKKEERVLLTFDRHFTNILLYPPHTHSGIIRIRLHPPQLEFILQALDNFLKSYDLAKMKGTLVILERDGFHIRRSGKD
jgi:predicted nuclease of predicted toxin-antitoxin system